MLPAEQVKQWRSQLGSLLVAESIDPKTLDLTPNPVNFSPRSERQLPPAANRLAALDDQLDDMLLEWTNSLKTTLEDPFLQLELLSESQRNEIQEFIKSGQLPTPVSKEFIAGVNEALSGLEEVKITTTDLVASLGKGTPQTLDEVKARFEKLITQHCQGKDLSKVRIIIE